MTKASTPINDLNKKNADAQRKIVTDNREDFKEVLTQYGFEVCPTSSSCFSGWNIRARHIGLDIAISFNAYPSRNNSVHFTYEEDNSPISPNQTCQRRHYGYFMSDSGLKKVIRHIEKQMAIGKKFKNKLS